MGGQVVVGLVVDRGVNGAERRIARVVDVFEVEGVCRVFPVIVFGALIEI
jgi:hypothetical protein